MFVEETRQREDQKYSSYHPLIASLAKHLTQAAIY